MTEDTKTKLIGMVCAGLDGRDPRQYVIDLDGDECVQGHNILKQLDDLLRSQWKLMGAPNDLEIL